MAEPMTYYVYINLIYILFMAYYAIIGNTTMYILVILLNLVLLDFKCIQIVLQLYNCTMLCQWHCHVCILRTLQNWLYYMYMWEIGWKFS